MKLNSGRHPAERVTGESKVAVVTRGRVALVVCACLMLMAVTVAPAAAQTKSRESAKKRQAEIDRQISTLRSEVAEASAEESALLGRIDVVRGKRQSLEREVAALDARIRTTEGELTVAEAALRRVERELATNKVKLRATEEQLSGARSDLKERAVAAYVGQPKSSVAGLALGVRSLRELSAIQVYYRTLVQDQEEKVDRYRGLRGQISDLREQLEDAHETAAKERDAVADTKAVLEQSRQGRERLRRDLAAQEATHEDLLREVKGRINEFESKIKSLRRESDAITALLRTVQAGQGKTVSGRGVLASPIPGARITSSYGSRVHPIFFTSRLHTGIDFGASSGTSIRAAANGVVVFVGSKGGYGNATIIDHGGSLATLYAHQSATSVKKDQKVTKGQVIGRVGSTGFSTGPHLHFEVRVAGAPVDPVRYL